MEISLEVFLIDNRIMLMFLNRVHPRLSLKTVVDAHAVCMFLSLVHSVLRHMLLGCSSLLAISLSRNYLISTCSLSLRGKGELEVVQHDEVNELS